jgi:hypothetical protein
VTTTSSANVLGKTARELLDLASFRDMTPCGAAGEDRHATCGRGSTRTVRSASSARAIRPSSGNVPPASNRATADCVRERTAGDLHQLGARAWKRRVRELLDLMSFRHPRAAG